MAMSSIQNTENPAERCRIARSCRFSWPWMLGFWKTCPPAASNPRWSISTLPSVSPFSPSKSMIAFAVLLRMTPSPAPVSRIEWPWVRTSGPELIR